MTRDQKLEKLEQLETIAYTISLYEERLMPNYYSQFVMSVIPVTVNHNKEINTKCLAYWKRRFNRILETLKYKA